MRPVVGVGIGVRSIGSLAYRWSQMRLRSRCRIRSVLSVIHPRSSAILPGSISTPIPISTPASISMIVPSSTSSTIPRTTWIKSSSSSRIHRWPRLNDPSWADLHLCLSLNEAQDPVDIFSRPFSALRLKRLIQGIYPIKTLASFWSGYAELSSHIPQYHHC